MTRVPSFRQQTWPTKHWLVQLSSRLLLSLGSLWPMVELQRCSSASWPLCKGNGCVTVEADTLQSVSLQRRRFQSGQWRCTLALFKDAWEQQQCVATTQWPSSFVRCDSWHSDTGWFLNVELRYFAQKTTLYCYKHKRPLFSLQQGAGTKLVGLSPP